MEFTVYKLGVKECQDEHVWVYKTMSMMNFTYPPTYVEKRICKICGEVHILSGEERHNDEYELFDELSKKFHNNS